MTKRLVYLDYAAATPMDPSVLKAMQPYFTKKFFNPSAGYQASRDIKKAVEGSRTKVAEVIGAKASEIIFTAGGTEANNLAITGVMSAFPKANLIISAIEHPSVIEPSKRFKHSLAPVDKDGIIKPRDLEKLIDDNTVLVSVMYVNNEIGTIEPLSDISKIIKNIRVNRLERGISLPIYFHTDAAQATNYLDLHTSRLGVDLMSLNGGKIYGPKQSGCLFIKAGATINPIIFGGGQEKGLRNGTENVPSIIGFTRALELAQKGRKINSKETIELQKYLLSRLKELPGTKINGSLTSRIANNISVTFQGIDNERLLIELDELGIMAASGSACSAAKDSESIVLKSIGLNLQESLNTIRFSLGKQTTAKDIDYLIDTLKGLPTTDK